MSDAAPTPDSGDVQSTVEQAALTSDAAVPATPSPNGTPASAPVAAVAAPAERPELVVGAAFAGGFALAFLLRRLGR